MNHETIAAVNSTAAVRGTAAVEITTTVEGTATVVRPMTTSFAPSIGRTGTRIGAALALGAGILLTGAAMAATAKPVGFDGTWQVRLTSLTGACADGDTYTIAVDAGRITLIGGSSKADSVSGGVTNDGAVALGIRRSIVTADAAGRLQARSGGGTWKVAALGCNGRWTAERLAATASR